MLPKSEFPRFLRRIAEIGETGAGLVRRTADGESVNAERRHADAGRNVLAVLAAGAAAPV